MATRKIITTSASEDRLESLIKARLEKNANKELIDKRIWDLFGETWCVMFTDLSGFSRNVAKFGIIHFLQTIYESERLLIPIIDDFDGILLKVEGDSFMVIFRNVCKGLECAVKMQNVLEEYNKDKTEEEKVLLCVGLGYGEMLRIGESDVFGFEVNSASKLGEDVAEKRDILVTPAVKGALEDASNKKCDYKYEEIKDISSGLKHGYKVVYK